jgi:general stress protein 26
MADLKEARERPEEQLWEELEDVRAGMLGVVGSDQHMQPMAPQLDRDGGRLWFFTKKSSDLVKSLKGGDRAHFCVVGEDQDYHACLAGALRENPDPEKIEEYWGPMTAAWFEKGRDDPELTLLEMELDDAAIWASSEIPIRFGWEIAKANLTDKTPDLGVRSEVRFQA